MKNRLRFVAKAVRGITLVFLGILFCLASSPQAQAQDIETPSQEVAGLQQTILGLGVAYIPDYEGSNDYTAAPLIQARWDWASGRYLSFLGNTLRADLVPGKTLSAGPALRYRRERKDVQEKEVDRLKDVNAALELGAFVDATVVDRLHLVVQLTQDVSRSYNGYLLDLGASYNMPIEKTAMLSLFVSSTYASSPYMDAYFSIRPKNRQNSTLPFYNSNKGFKDVGGGALLQLNLTDKWGVLGAFKYSRLVGDADKSPVVNNVGDSNQYIAGVAVNYRF